MSTPPVWQLPGGKKAFAPKELRYAADAVPGTAENIRRTVTFHENGVVLPGKELRVFPCAVCTGIFD